MKCVCRSMEFWICVLSLLYAVCGKSKSSKKGHCISTKPWWIWTLPSVHCCLILAVTCYKFWKFYNLLEFDEGSCYFWVCHPVGTLAFVVWCLYKIFWGVCLFCVSWILLQGSLINVRGERGQKRIQRNRDEKICSSLCYGLNGQLLLCVSILLLHCMVGCQRQC